MLLLAVVLLTWGAAASRDMFLDMLRGNRTELFTHMRATQRDIDAHRFIFVVGNPQSGLIYYMLAIYEIHELYSFNRQLCSSQVMVKCAFSIPR